MLNRTKEEAVKYIRENHKSFGGTQTNKQVGYELGVSGARISQMRGEMKGPATPCVCGEPDIPDVTHRSDGPCFSETALAPEAA